MPPKGTTVPSEVRARISKTMTGQPKTLGHRRNMGLRQQGNKNLLWSATGWGVKRAYYFVRILSGKYINHARAVWVQANGPLPSELMIHHRDGDSFNDSLENLEAMTRSQHTRLHKREGYKYLSP